MLLLFDIDGTLLRAAAAAHAQALRVALHSIYGIGSSDGAAEAFPKLQAAGRTDIEIARELAAGRGCEGEAFERSIGLLEERCVSEYEQRAPEDLSMHVVEGIDGLLSELSEDDSVILSLLTGNLEGIARIKLDKAGLGGYFAGGQGAFGSDSEHRNDLPAIARRRAGAPGEPHPRTDTLLIGDTPRDIACARADAVRCIAVTSGPFEALELEAADWVAESTLQLRELLSAQLRVSRL